MLEAEKAHRAHAIVEQVIADLKHGPLAHLPSGSFAANSAWAVCAAMAYNLTRTAGVHASAFHAKATTGTIRAQLINVPGRLARSARKLVLHLPVHWPWETAGRRWSPPPEKDHPSRPDRTPRPLGPTRNRTWRPPARPGTNARPQAGNDSAAGPGASAITRRWIQA